MRHYFVKIFIFGVLHQLSIHSVLSNWQESLSDMLESSPISITNSDQKNAYLALTELLTELKPSLKPPTLTLRDGSSEIDLVQAWLGYYKILLDRQFWENGQNKEIKQQHGHANSYQKQSDSTNIMDKNTKVNTGSKKTPRLIPEVGRVEAYEPSKNWALQTFLSQPRVQQQLIKVFKSANMVGRQNLTLNSDEKVIWVTPGAHGARLPGRLNLLNEWRTQHRKQAVKAWFVVTGDRVMDKNEHRILAQTVHPEISAKDIKAYAQNENDYWPVRTHQLLKQPGYKLLSTLPKPKFLTPGIFAWVHQTPPPRATTKDNAVALAKALLDEKLLDEQTVIVIAVESPFDIRMPMIFEKLLKLHGVNNRVVAYHGSQDLVHAFNETQLLKAFGLDRNHLIAVALNQMAMNLVERFNCYQLAESIPSPMT